MTGRPYLMRVIGFGFRRPKNRVPGLDVAGTVVALGSAVTRFAVGDEVYGVARGSYGEYAAALEDKLALKPRGLSFEQAAVVPVSALIAQRGLLDVGRLESGQKVLITGASGGVGSYAVQLAKAFGAEVTGVCGTGEARPGQVPRGRPRPRLHPSGLRGGDGALRPDPRRRRQPVVVPAAPSAHPARNGRHPRRRAGAWPRDRRLRQDVAGTARVVVRQPAARDGGQRRERDATSNGSRPCSRTDGSHPPSIAPTRSSRSPTPCASSSPGTSAARSPSPI